MKIYFTLFVIFFCSASLSGQTVELHKSCSDYKKNGRLGRPKYSVERQEVAGDNKKGLFLDVAVEPNSTDELTLAEIACRLPNDFSKWDALNVSFFDDTEAAKKLALYATDQPNYGTYLWHLRARVVFDRLKNSMFLEFLIPEVRDELLAVKRFKVWLNLPTLP
jgi:hypothetical protein